MNLYDLFYRTRRLSNKKNLNYKNAIILLEIISMLTICSKTESINAISVDSYSDSYSELSSCISCVSRCSDFFANNVYKGILGYVDNYYSPMNLDFSDFPYNDGAVEAPANIARYIREKISFIPNEYKYNFILDYFQIPPEEFAIMRAITNREGKSGENRYEDVFGVVTSYFNRMIDTTKCGYVRSRMQAEGPVTMYQHLIAKNQYQPYGSGSYLEVLGVDDPESDQALLDALFTIDFIPERMHYYLDFVGNGQEYRRSVNIKMVPNENNFSNLMLPEKTIPLEERYYYNKDFQFEFFALKKVIR